MTIVRPATVTVEPLTSTQRKRQTEANQMAGEITEASRGGTRPWLGSDLHLPLDYMPRIRDLVGGIIRNTPVLAANPPAGAVRIGRNNRGRVVVAVLHAAAWSLLLRPAQPCPAVWAFLDEFGGHPIWFYGDGDRLTLQWDEMTQAVFTALTT